MNIELPRTVQPLVLQGHVINVLRQLPPESVQCVVTSPPYWGLRSYGTEPQVWGGKDDCAHDWGNKSGYVVTASHGKTARVGNTVNNVTSGVRWWWWCVHCNAWRGELGQEPTPQLFIEHLTEVFREVRRVLRPDGTLWVNIGDSYAGYWGEKYAHKPFGADRTPDASTPPSRPTIDFGAVGVKPKDLIGVPWMLAFALRDDGWWLRGDMVWSKPNRMPESVMDRPTRAHEYIFLFTKSERYYYDNTAVRQPYSEATYERINQPTFDEQEGGEKDGINPNRSAGKTLENLKTRIESSTGVLGANLGSVWSIPTHSYSGAHFATFSPELPSRCILLGSKQNDVILDPFAGSGTTLAVARKLNRRSIGIELNPKYIGLIENRPEAGVCVDDEY
jgi:DNA modification methylase